MVRILAVALNPTIDISCAADRVQPTLKVRTRDQAQDPGGGGTNVARVIAKLGGDPDLAFLSGGASGALFEDLLNGQNIRLHRFGMSGSVRVAMMVYENDTGFEYRFIPEGPKIRGEELQPVLDFVDSFDGDYIVASGSLPIGAPEDTYVKLANSAASRGLRFVLDTSGPALRAALKEARVFLLKPSIGELERYVGYKLDEDGVSKAASAIVAIGAAENIVVSMGRDGALLANASGITRVPAIHVKTLSAVGAGDSFVGAMTWWLSQGNSVDEAFRFGVAAGAAAAMTPGTQLCRREDVFALFHGAGRQD